MLTDVKRWLAGESSGASTGSRVLITNAQVNKPMRIMHIPIKRKLKRGRERSKERSPRSVRVAMAVLAAIR